MSDITLSSAVRTSLISLQSTADLLTVTQERLATGNEVNSALDDPTAFFTAAALSNRAADLSTLLDSQGQAIRVVEAADQGISAIEDLVASARAQATSALQTESLSVRATAAEAFDDILGQIEDLANDASFNGTNLLAGDDLLVVFSEDGTSNLTVEGFTFTDVANGLGLSPQGGVTPASGIVNGPNIAADETLTLSLNGSDFTISESDVLRAAAPAGPSEDTIAISSLEEGDVLNFTVNGQTTTITVGPTADTGALATQIQTDLGASGFTILEDGTDLTISNNTGDFTVTQQERTEAAVAGFAATGNGFATGDDLVFEVAGGTGPITLTLTDPSLTSIADQINASTDLQNAGISATGANGALSITSDDGDFTLTADTDDDALTPNATVIDTSGNIPSGATAFGAAADATATTAADSTDTGDGGTVFTPAVEARAFDPAGIADFINTDAALQTAGFAASETGGIITISNNTGNFTISDGGDPTSTDSVNVNADGFRGSGTNFSTDADVNVALAAIDNALNTLRSAAASLGSDLSTIQVRQDFTESLINTLEAGAGDLTLADLNEEGANLLTLQTRQQLASTSLSFATQADQAVLSLFG